MTPSDIVPYYNIVTPVLSVTLNGLTSKIKVKAGDQGRIDFIHDVKKNFGLEKYDVAVSFHAEDPITQKRIMTNFDGAVHCATVCAARVMKSNIDYEYGCNFM